MATLNEARERIYQAFDTGWAGLSIQTFDGEKFTPPTDADWVRLAVRHDGRAQDSLGGVGRRKFESVGRVLIQCFTPLNEGAAGADVLATAAMDIFEGKTLSPEQIRFTSAAPIEIGPTDDWYLINVEAFFTYTETK